MKPETNIKPVEKQYKGCYSCANFKRSGETISGYGKCITPVNNCYFIVNWEYVESGTFNYPERFYPTAGICCIDDCPNWREDKNNEF